MMKKKKTEQLSLDNIKRNLNRKTVLPHLPLLVLGLILMWFGYREALALIRLVGLVLLGLGVFRLGRALLSPDIREDAAYREEDAALSGEIGRLQRVLRLLRLALGGGGVLFFASLVILATSGSWVPLVIACIIIGLIYWGQERYQNKMKAFVAENIVRQALEEVFEIETYLPFGNIDDRHIRGKYFGIGSFDKASGSDYVRGKYRGLPIEMCDMHLTERRTRTNDEGNTEEYDETVFRGFWLICDFEKELSAELRLWERGKMGKLVGGKGISTDNEKFNRHFQIESEIEQEAFYILTPHMMEYILEMDKKAAGETHMRFDRNGKVQIAISTGRDGFEVGKTVKDATVLRRQFVREIRYITDIIDELRLVDTLYRR